MLHGSVGIPGAGMGTGAAPACASAGLPACPCAVLTCCPCLGAHMPQHNAIKVLVSYSTPWWREQNLTGE